MIESVMKLHKCDNCAIRCRASRKPGSLFARIHRWHATWWPGWKLYQAALRVQRAKARPSLFAEAAITPAKAEGIRCSS